MVAVPCRVLCMKRIGIAMALALVLSGCSGGQILPKAVAYYCGAPAEVRSAGRAVLAAETAPHMVQVICL